MRVGGHATSEPEIAWWLDVKGVGESLRDRYNPGWFQLMDLADDFSERAKELEAQKAKEEAVRHA